MQLAQLVSTLVERLAGFIQSWEVQPQHAYLFGSAARQDGDTSSDVDVLLVHEKDWQEPPSPWAEQVDAQAFDRAEMTPRAQSRTTPCNRQRMALEQYLE
jgi:Nucleotidyltransferase domain